MKKALLILLSLITASFVFSEDIPKDLAIKVATNYYFQSVNSLSENKNIKFEEISLSCIQNPSIDESSFLYIFNVNNDEGFIIVSSNDNVKPILAYSFESEFNIDNISPSQQYLLNYYELMNSEARQSKLIISEDIKKEWQELSKFKSNQEFKAKTTVEGLLGPIEWNQSMPYNAMCPEDTGTPTGYGGHCPVGCSAIAMLQIMKYYNWPQIGTGTYTHHSWDNGGYEDYTVNFSENIYDWYSMPNVGQQPNDELAKTCFHAGVAVKMQWSPQGSGASLDNVALALLNYFQYDGNINLLYKYDFNEEDWKNLLREQIDAKKPVVYAGFSDEAGHAWNCDGYQDEDYFHMNWGWGGYGNGFYTLDALGTTATPGSTEDNYNQWQQAIIDIFPDTTYPIYCNDQTFINGVSGSFDDGSSYENYQNNSNCTYIIEPECRQIIALEFTKFELAQGDYLKLWDGTPEENILLETFDVNNIPEDIEYEATSGKMTIEFISDDNLNADGWAINYKTKTCNANSIYTQPTGSFDDGSKSCQYNEATLCSWYIQPENTNEIYIDFEYFNLSEGIDFVNIYKNSVKSDNLVESYNHDNIPTNILQVNADTAIVRFFAGSNSSLGEGWKINYSSSFNKINKSFIADEISIYPNPGNANSNIIFKSDSKKTLSIKAYNVLGEQVGQHSFDLLEGQNLLPISKIVKLVKPGMYYISIKSKNNLYSLPFIMSE